MSSASALEGSSARFLANGSGSTELPTAESTSISGDESFRLSLDEFLRKARDAGGFQPSMDGRAAADPRTHAHTSTNVTTLHRKDLEHLLDASGGLSRAEMRRLALDLFDALLAQYHLNRDHSHAAAVAASKRRSTDGDPLNISRSPKASKGRSAFKRSSGDATGPGSGRSSINEDPISGPTSLLLNLDRISSVRNVQFMESSPDSPTG